MTDKPTGDLIADTLYNYLAASPRTEQSKAGVLGVSDVGGCRQYAVYRTIGQDEDTDRSYFSSGIGTAIHDLIDAAVLADPDSGWVTKLEVTVEYPNGAKIIGHPDLVSMERNEVVDIKTVNGLHLVERTGPSTHQWWQVNAYTHGLLAEGTLTGEPTCTLVFVDRSGADDRFLTFSQPYSHAMHNEASFWIDDVIYAVQNGEQASRDKPYEFCERWCEFFQTCRGEDRQPEGLITDPDIAAAADMYLDGMKLEKTGKALKAEARTLLVGAEGSTGRAIVRWTSVGPSEVPSVVRDGYMKLNVAPIKGDQ